MIDFVACSAPKSIFWFENFSNRTEPSEPNNQTEVNWLLSVWFCLDLKQSSTKFYLSTNIWSNTFDIQTEYCKYTTSSDIQTAVISHVYKLTFIQTLVNKYTNSWKQPYEFLFLKKKQY